MKSDNSIEILNTNQRNIGFGFRLLGVFPIQPSYVFRMYCREDKAVWQAPLFFLSITLLVSIVVSSYFQARIAAMHGITLPADAQWWSPEMRENYIQAMQQAQGIAFVYVIPAMTGLARVWLGWLTLGAAFHLMSTFLGGRGTMITALNITAWASYPYALQEVLRTIFILIVKRPIQSPGLSGFLSGDLGGAFFFSHLLKQVDLFLVWFVILAFIGFSISESLPWKKVIIQVSLILMLSLFGQAGLGVIVSQLSSLLMSKTF